MSGSSGAQSGSLVLRLFAWACLLEGAIAMSSCTLGDAPSNCVPKQLNECTDENGHRGQQECSPDGYKYGPCIAYDARTEGPIIIDAGPDAPQPILIGAPCITDADCGDKLFCLDVASKKIFSEGPPNGICTADCAKRAAICTDLDPASVCRTFDDNGTTTTTTDDVAFCMRGCTTGTPSSFAKCFGRHDMGCIALGSSTTNGICIPVCRNDADCGSRYCDLASGMCADAARTGSPVGSACSASATNECTGYCSVSIANAYSSCSGYCSNGRVGCGQDGSAPYDVFCVTPQLSGGGWAEGDFGYCEKLCDCDKECGRTDDVCSPLPVSEASTLGKKGACRSAILSGNDLRPGLPCSM